jgi:hypothetical protein
MIDQTDSTEHAPAEVTTTSEDTPVVVDRLSATLEKFFPELAPEGRQRATATYRNEFAVQAEDAVVKTMAGRLAIPEVAREFGVEPLAESDDRRRYRSQG